MQLFMQPSVQIVHQKYSAAVHVKKNKSILHTQVLWLVKPSLLLKVMIQERGNSIMGGNNKGKLKTAMKT